MAYIISRDDLRRTGNAYRFQGEEHGGVAASFFWLSTLPGQGAFLHKHPYEEIFVLQEGQVTFTIGDETVVAHSGQVVIVPANTPHKFLNSGDAPIQMISIQPSPKVIQEVLEN